MKIKNKKEKQKKGQQKREKRKKKRNKKKISVQLDDKLYHKNVEGRTKKLTLNANLPSSQIPLLSPFDNLIFFSYIHSL